MFNKIKEFFLGKPKADTPQAPYKVEAATANWPFPRASEIAPEPAPVVATAPAKKPRAPARPKAAVDKVSEFEQRLWEQSVANMTPETKPAKKAPAEKPVVLKKPRAKKTPAK